MQRRDLLKLLAASAGLQISPSIAAAIEYGLDTAPLKNGVLDSIQLKNISVLTEMIIPTTDTPGAISAGVPQFIATIIESWYEKAEREVFEAGLTRIEEATRAAEACSFFQASPDLRNRLLALQEEEALAYKASQGATSAFSKEHDANSPFFAKLKELVIVGYYTSEIGCTVEQVYAPMSGSYEGNLDFSDFGRRIVSME